MIVRMKMVRHLVENNLVNDIQHGFKEIRGTLTNLQIYMKALTTAMDKQKPVEDKNCHKAFDTSPHARLLTKIDAYQIKGKIFDWIKTFLTGREQQVEMKGSKYKVAVTSGVLHGSVLGPLLFFDI